jgi:hypothetical protein
MNEQYCWMKMTWVESWKQCRVSYKTANSAVTEVMLDADTVLLLEIAKVAGAAEARAEMRKALGL